MQSQGRTVGMLVVLILVSADPAAFAEEFSDHPLIGRYEGSSVLHQEASNRNEYTLATGPVQDGTVSRTLKIEGKVMMTLYRAADNASSFEVITAYRKLLQSLHFEILSSCEKSACGEGFLKAAYGLAPFASDYGWNNSAPVTNGNPDLSYVLAAKSESGGTLTYVSLIVSQGWFTYPVYKLDVVDVQAYEGGISSSVKPGQAAASDAPGASGTAASRQAVHRPLRFGFQVSSDSFFGLLLYANGFEIGAKVQAWAFDGFPSNEKPDDLLMVGGHACFLFRLSDEADLGVGVDAWQGIPLTGSTVFKQYLDAGLRIGYNFRLGERFMVSAVLYPFWVSVRETDVADSYSLSAKIPSAAVSASFFF